MSEITHIVAREVLDSRGDPTVEAVVTAKGGFQGAAMVPAGASTGKYEAHELRDEDSDRYRGKGVTQAVANVNGEIRDALTGVDTSSQRKVDHKLIELDGTDNKSRLGANAILAVSLAAARCEASAQGVPLYMYLEQLDPDTDMAMPVPQMNLINGGKHADNDLSIQEYHVLPVGSPNFKEALRMGVEIHHALKVLLVEEGYRVEVGDEGGFAPRLEQSDTAFGLLVTAIQNAGYVPGSDAFLGIDAAASEFFDRSAQMYNLDGEQMSGRDLAHRMNIWHEEYPLISYEDPFDQDDWETWSTFMDITHGKVQIVGDDLYATNVERIQTGIKEGATNAVLIKPNQVGTLTETLDAVREARSAEQNVVISHRSGETEDTFIADLSVIAGAGQIKTGAPSRSDRTSKYNRLLAIEEETNAKLGHTLQPFLEAV